MKVQKWQWERDSLAKEERIRKELLENHKNNWNLWLGTHHNLETGWNFSRMLRFTDWSTGAIFFSYAYFLNKVSSSGRFLIEAYIGCAHAERAWKSYLFLSFWKSSRETPARQVDQASSGQGTVWLALSFLLMWPQKVTRSPLSFPGAVCKLIPTHNFLQKLLRLKLRLVFPPPQAVTLWWNPHLLFWGFVARIISKLLMFSCYIANRSHLMQVMQAMQAYRPVQLQ